MENATLALKAKLFRGLGDLSRLSIVEALRSGEMAVNEIVAATGLTQPNVSAHLTCLKDCGLLKSRQEGRFVYYSLATNLMDDVIHAAEQIIALTFGRILCCSNYDCQSTKKCTDDVGCISVAQIVHSQVPLLPSGSQ